MADYTVYRVCVDCYFTHANGATQGPDGQWYPDGSDTPTDREPLAEIPPGRYIAQDRDDGPDGNADDGFSMDRCEGCRSALGGDRFRLAVFDPEPADPTTLPALPAVEGAGDRFDLAEGLAVLAHDYGLYAVYSRLTEPPLNFKAGLSRDTLAGLDIQGREVYGLLEPWAMSNPDPYTVAPWAELVLATIEEGDDDDVY